MDQFDQCERVRARPRGQCPILIALNYTCAPEQVRKPLASLVGPAQLLLDVRVSSFDRLEETAHTQKKQVSRAIKDSPDNS